MRFKQVGLIVFLSLTSLWPVVQLQASVPASDPLSEVVLQGVNHAFTIQTQKLTLDSSHESQTVNYSALLPKLSLSASQSYGTSQTQDSVLGTVTNGSANSTQMLLSASWTLWDNYASIRNIQIGNKNIQEEKIKSNQTVQKYIFDLVSAYLNYELSLRTREITASHLEQSKSTDEQSQIMVKVGAMTKLDAMDTEIQVSSDELALADQDAAIEAARRALLTLINAETIDKLPRLDFLVNQPYFLNNYEAKVAKIKNNWSKDLVEVNPDIRVQRIELEKNMLSLQQTKLSYFPTTQIVANQQFDGSDYLRTNNPSGQRAWLSGNSVALTLTWQFWDWLATPANVALSRNTYESSVITLNQLNKQTSTTLQNLLDHAELLKKTIATAKLVLEKAKKQQEYSKEVFRLGRITLLTMQQATNRLSTAQTDLATRLEDQAVTVANILYMMGEDLTPPGADLSWIR